MLQIEALVIVHVLYLYFSLLTRIYIYLRIIWFLVSDY